MTQGGPGGGRACQHVSGTLGVFTTGWSIFWGSTWTPGPAPTSHLCGSSTNPLWFHRHLQVGEWTSEPI